MRRKYFRRIWMAMTVSSLGDWLGVFALTAYVKNLSHNPEFAIGGVLLFRVLPALLFGQLAGVFADRFDRRRMMITADITRALLIASVPFMKHLYLLFAISAVMEVLSLMWTPAKDATIPHLVERDQLLTANQLSLITTYGTFPISGTLLSLFTAIAAVLAGTFTVLKAQPISLAFFVDALTFFFSAAMIARLPERFMRTKRATEKLSLLGALRDFLEGWRFVRQKRGVSTLVTAAWTAFVGGAAVISLGPLISQAAYPQNRTAADAGWGFLVTSIGLGLVGGMIAAGPLAKRFPRDRLYPAGLVLGGSSVILTAVIQSFPIEVGITFFSGFGAGVTWVTVFTLLHERSDDRLRGRTFAALYSGVQLSLFLGLALWPVLTGVIGTHVVHAGSLQYRIQGFRPPLVLGGSIVALAGLRSARLIRRFPMPGKGGRLRGLEFKQPLMGAAREGLFIVFEGVEGAGKSTQMFSLQTFLKEYGREVVLTREPGGTAIGERIRDVLLDTNAKEMDSKTEALMYSAARAQHVRQVIRPALEQGAAVLCDRYLDSSIVYQGIARGLGDDDIYALNVWATDELIPDLVILLNLDPAVGLARGASGVRDRIESEDIAFHRRVAAGYLELARKHPSRFVVIDASAPPNDVAAAIQKAVYNLLQDE
ncbi:MAG: dTMP kinase [Actinomycetota bacterium]